MVKVNEKVVKIFQETNPSSKVMVRTESAINGDSLSKLENYTDRRGGLPRAPILLPLPPQDLEPPLLSSDFFSSFIHLTDVSASSPSTFPSNILVRYCTLRAILARKLPPLFLCGRYIT